ncbi:MAG: Sir2 family NAD-dependent protein deacetylase, partial [Anaerolineales bacterium]
MIELHGNITRTKCFDCERFAETWVEDGNIPPTCPACGGYLRPDVVWFHEPLPHTALTAATEAAQICNVFFSIGTSGIVEPAASLPFEALRHGAVVVEVNPDDTPLTAHATYTLRGPA